MTDLELFNVFLHQIRAKSSVAQIEKGIRVSVNGDGVEYKSSWFFDYGGAYLTHEGCKHAAFVNIFAFKDEKHEAYYIDCWTMPDKISLRRVSGGIVNAINGHTVNSQLNSTYHFDTQERAVKFVVACGCAIVTFKTYSDFYRAWIHKQVDCYGSSKQFSDKQPTIN